MILPPTYFPCCMTSTPECNKDEVDPKSNTEIASIIGTMNKIARRVGGVFVIDPDKLRDFATACRNRRDRKNQQGK